MQAFSCLADGLVGLSKRRHPPMRSRYVQNQLSGGYCVRSPHPPFVPLLHANGRVSVINH